MSINDRSGEYWVSIDRDSNTGIIHTATRPYVGYPQQDSTDPEWHGPYRSITQAGSSTFRLDTKIVRNCQVCNR